MQFRSPCDRCYPPTWPDRPQGNPQYIREIHTVVHFLHTGVRPYRAGLQPATAYSFVTADVGLGGPEPVHGEAALPVATRSFEREGCAAQGMVTIVLLFHGDIRAPLVAPGKAGK